MIRSSTDRSGGIDVDNPGYQFDAMVGDPDDHRPDSSWALVVDSGDQSSRVDDLAVISERIAPGDRIPLHVHRVNEVILVHGAGQYTLGDETRPVGDGAVVFIPAGMPHGLRNDGDAPLPLEAVFPTTRGVDAMPGTQSGAGNRERPAAASRDLRLAHGRAGVRALVSCDHGNDD